MDKLCHKQMHISKLFSYLHHQVKSTKSIRTQIQHIHPKKIEQVVPFSVALVILHVRWGQAGIINHSVCIIDTRLEKNTKKGTVRTTKKRYTIAWRQTPVPKWQKAAPTIISERLNKTHTKSQPLKKKCCITFWKEVISRQTERRNKQEDQAKKKQDK